MLAAEQIPPVHAGRVVLLGGGIGLLDGGFRRPEVNVFSGLPLRQGPRRELLFSPGGGRVDVDLDDLALVEADRCTLGV